MSDAPGQIANEATRFSSMAAMRSTHGDLLKRHRRSGNTCDMLMAMEDFLRRGRVTGVLLDTDSDRHAAQSLLDYWTTILYRAGIEPPDASLVEFDPDLAPDLEDALCPFVGLEAFREADSSRFFGFEPLLADCLLRLNECRLLAIVGPPGSGKSSLVQAALLPALKSGMLNGSQNWHYYPPIIPGSDPLVSLVRLIQPLGDVKAEWTASQVEHFRENTSLLARHIAGPGDEPAVIVVDQFEEVFTLCDDASARLAFVDNLLNLNQAPDKRHAVILTMRSGFLSHVARLSRLLLFFHQAQIHVMPLDASSLREAIVRPAQLIGLKFEEGLVDELLKEFLGEPNALPLLQFTLMQLWENRNHNRITWKAYRQLGSGRQALARGADAFCENLTLEEQQTSKRILLRMIHLGEGLNFISNRVRRSSLYRSGETPDSIDQVLAKLISARLVRLTHADSPVDAQVELAHEALVSNWPRLVEWLEDQRIATTQRLRLLAAAEQWRETGREPGALWGGGLLDEALRHQDLNELETEFVQASRLAADARARCIDALSAAQAAEMKLVEANRLRDKTVPNAHSMEAQPRRLTLLVVDDEVDVVESLRNQFRVTYRVLTATSGGQAIQLLHQHEVHLILSDQRMPGMQGDALLSKARRLQPDAIRMLFTGYADIQAVINAVNDGRIFRYILKPWDTVKLEEIIRQAAEQYDLLAERKRLIAELQEANRLKGACIEIVNQELNADFRRPIAESTQAIKLNPNDTAVCNSRATPTTTRAESPVPSTTAPVRPDSIPESIKYEHGSMPDDEQFRKLLESSLTELQMKTTAHQGRWGFDKFDRWKVDQDRGLLIISNQDGTTVTCLVQIIGSYDSVVGTWRWAWASPSIADSLKTDSLKVREYGETHQIERLTEPEWAAKEEDARAMTALAVKLCEAEGAYRGPAGRSAVFMSFREGLIW